MSEKMCSCDIHKEIVEKVSKSLPDDNVLYNTAELMKVFGDPTRIRILFVLGQSELCVCDIANLIGMTQSAVSHQLRVLKQARLVTARRSGKAIFYTLCDNHVHKIIECAMEHVME
ncbi:MAG: winged helix-turn-helix transcriptional regulator [Ruminococcus sp.]|nr:winged helix-turn-helix transcriptional regulator [Ruminococcus sp.]